LLSPSLPRFHRAENENDFQKEPTMPHGFRSLCCFSVLFFLGCRAAQPKFPQGRIVDLSYAFDEQTIFWPTEKGFMLDKGPAGVTGQGYYYSANRFCSAEHGGTHIDAPIHFFESRHTVDAIPVQQLIGSGAIVDVAVQCASNPDYQVRVEDFLGWERRQELRLDNAIVLLRTGFGRFWPERAKYLGTEEQGSQAIAKLHFPGLHPEAAKWLVEQRAIKAIGIDTASIDYGQSTRFETHVTLCDKNIPALENVAKLDQLPETGFTVIALPMKIRNGSGGPVRIVAVMDR
jgi:kynurenine formamidase